MKVLLAANSTFSARSEFENFFDFLSHDPQISLTSLAHPLLRNQAQQKTELKRWADGQLRITERRRHVMPPMSFVLDWLHQRLREKFDVIIGFNPVQTVFLKRFLDSHGVLVNWAIDFVPSEHYPVTLREIYEAIDRRMVKSVDLLIENNRVAANARSARAKCEPKQSMIVPITINDYWMHESNTVRQEKNIIYTGTMNTRNGIDFLIHVAEQVLTLDKETSFTFIGDGPELPNLRARVQDLGMGHRVEIMGYVDDEQIVLSRLRQASIAVAPYARNPLTFTQFADPQKLKWYASTGVPIIVSPEPPSSTELEKCGGAIVIRAETKDDVNEWSQQIVQLLGDGPRRMYMETKLRKWASGFSREYQYQRVWTAIKEIHSNK
jgi:glycosyltransferase involved in cell wall biosynthesis